MVELTREIKEKNNIHVIRRTFKDIWVTLSSQRQVTQSAHIVKIFIFLYDSISHPMNMSAKEKFDLDKMQSFLEVLKTFKFAAILVHHSHQSSLLFE